MVFLSVHGLLQVVLLSCVEVRNGLVKMVEIIALFAGLAEPLEFIVSGKTLIAEIALNPPRFLFVGGNS